ncbi:MAG: hypothetical protein Q4G11_06635, partial [Gallicola sp.]|nr:hypothetical protein [Gallicola sp.]
MKEVILKKILIAILFCVILVSLALSPTVNASNFPALTNAEERSKGFDTLLYPNDIYAALASNNMEKDDEVIANTIVGYLATEKAYVRCPDLYTRAIGFVEDKALSSKTIAYRTSESEYLKELNKLMGWTIYKDNLSFRDFKVSICKDVANASIVEDYQYFIDDDFDEESFRRRKYSFEMIKTSDG